MQTPELQPENTSVFNPMKAVGHSSRFVQSIQKIKTSKIMIIDDEPLLARVVQRFLKSAGYQEFTTVSDSREAIVKINSEQPDVCLLYTSPSPRDRTRSRMPSSA